MAALAFTSFTTGQIESKTQVNIVIAYICSRGLLSSGVQENTELILASSQFWKGVCPGFEIPALHTNV